MTKRYESNVSPCKRAARILQYSSILFNINIEYSVSPSGVMTLVLIIVVNLEVYIYTMGIL